MPVSAKYFLTDLLTNYIWIELAARSAINFIPDEGVPPYRSVNDKMLYTFPSETSTHKFSLALVHLKDLLSPYFRIKCSIGWSCPSSSHHKIFLDTGLEDTAESTDKNLGLAGENGGEFGKEVNGELG